MRDVIVVEDLAKRYATVSALRGVSVRVGEGEIFAMIGPNGAGKTTFVRAITGTLTPTEGTVRLFGRRPHEIPRDRIGLLPQSYHPPRRLTGREILRYYAGLYAHARPIADVLADVGMTDASDRWYERLSGGERRRICVGAALVNDPDLLVLDEPTTGIDPRGRRQVWDLLDRLREQGRSVLLTTHDMAEAATLGDRVGLLADGRLVAAGAPDSLIREHAGTGRIIVEPIDTGANAKLEGLDREIVERQRGFAIEGVSVEELPEVIDSIEASGIEYARISWEQPTLEDVFLALVGDSEVTQ